MAKVARHCSGLPSKALQLRTMLTSNQLEFLMEAHNGISAKIVEEVVALGASPRGVQSLILAGKVRALLDGRFAVAVEDLAAVSPDVLRHRILINFQGMSDGVTADEVIQQVISR